MSSVATVVAIIATIAAFKAVRRTARRGVSGRSRAFLVVVTLIALQTVAGAPVASAAECGEAPNPERPGTGMVGAMDAAKDRGEPGSPYADYSYAGMVWHTYETDCEGLSGITDANTTLDTWAGNQLFNIGKNITGATNGLHYTVMQGSLFNPLFDAVKKGTEAVYSNIYAQLFGLVALLLAIVMFRHIWRGDLATVSKRGLFALGAVWLAASSLALLKYFDTIDNAIVDTTTKIQAGFVDETEVDPDDVLPTNLHREIVYQNWLRGEFGRSDSDEAKKHGMDLLDAQAFTWAEMARGDDGDSDVIREKNEEYERIAEELEQSQSEGYFTGEDGSRTGAGFISAVQGVVYSLFQLLAKAAVLLAQILIRLLTLTAPLLGLVALLHHDILRKVAKVAGTVAFSLVVLATLAGVHALLLNAIFAASGRLSMLAQIAIAALVTILLFVVGKPVRRLWQMVDVTTRTVGAALPSSPGLFSRFRRGSDAPTPQDRFWETARHGDTDTPDEAPGALGTTTDSGLRARPEARGPLAAMAQRLDGGNASERRGSGSAEQTSALSTTAGRPALPAGGTPNPARLGFNPAGGVGDGVMAEAHRERHTARASTPRRPDAMSPPQARAQRLDRPATRFSPAPQDSESVVVPSAMAGRQPEYAAPAASGATARPAGRGPQPPPRPVETEMVNGRPVHVLYRPSRGLEVRQRSRDTDSVVR